jgi:outer membrane biosynthesis protein TonB
MKISVQFEADSAEEYDRVLEVLTGPGRSMFHVKPAAELVAQETQPTPAPKPAPVTQPIPQPEPKVEEPIEPTKPEQPEEPLSPSVVKGKRGRPKKAQPIIETPAEIVATVVNGPVATQPAQDTVVRQDLLDTFNAYVQRYGYNFGYTDVSKLLQQTFGDDVKKSSDVTDADIGKAIAVVRAAINDNPFNRRRADAAA